MSIFSLNQRINQLMSSIDKMSTKITSTTITPTTITGTSVQLNFTNQAFMVFTISMTANIQAFTFQNPVINGNYKIYLNSTGFMIAKVLGPNIRNNLSGNTFIKGYWTIDIFFDGNIFFCNFENYT